MPGLLGSTSVDLNVFIRAIRISLGNKHLTEYQLQPKPYCKDKRSLTNFHKAMHTRSYPHTQGFSISENPHSLPGSYRSRGSEAGPTCDRSFPCTRMWRQTSSRRASPDSILSCGCRNVQPVTEAFTRVHWPLLSASSLPLQV